VTIIFNNIEGETFTFVSCKTFECQHCGFVDEHIQAYDEIMGTEGYEWTFWQ